MSGKRAAERPASHFARGQVRRSDLTGSSAVLFSEGLALRKLPSGNPFPHDMAGGRPVGEKPTLRVEQSAFADGHLPTDM
jgi:hypothetical protein